MAQNRPEPSGSSPLQGWTQLYPLAAFFQLCDLDAKSPYISTSPHPTYLTLFDPWQLSVLAVGAQAFKLTLPQVTL